jgi:hypothetical protein
VNARSAWMAIGFISAGTSYLKAGKIGNHPHCKGFGTALAWFAGFEGNLYPQTGFLSVREP